MTRTRKAFTLVEMLIVIAIISILAAMAISSFSNAAQDSREVLVRQQLAVIQEAANNWAARQIGQVTTSGQAGKSITTVRTAYNATANAAARLDLFDEYLDESTRTQSSTGLVVNNTNGRITTDAMRQSGYYLTLPDWEAGSFPKVRLSP